MDARIGTWNLENLFRPGGEFGPEEHAVYTEKLDGLARTIEQMAPDVLGVQEVGSAAALDDLVAVLGGDWHVALSAHFDQRRPIRVGFLSRHPLRILEDVGTYPPRFAPVQTGDPDQDGVARTSSALGRGALAVRAELPGERRVTVVCCHLKSKLLSFPGPGGASRFSPRDEEERARVGGYALFRRTGEAVTVRSLVTRLLAAGDGDPVVLVGDLNDEPQAATTQVLYGPPGSQLGTRGFDVADGGDPQRLWNLARLIASESERFTRRFEGRGELIDHVLASRALLDPLPEVQVFRQAGLPRLPSVTDDPRPRRNVPASDHAAVLARFPA
jgi:endonuclease/exonuclease/phosphatase family metal-dependent hydrolase